VSTAAAAGGDDGSSSSSVSRSSGFGFGSRSRMWTNVILGVNLLVFGAQIASQGKLLLLGAKVNSLIDKGQWWRLVTYSLLHADVMHLLVNSYSLNSVGPTVESLGGGKRFLAVYAFSALASSGLSYTFCTAPSVGASGAIFGLVGALAVFLARHKTLMIGGDQSLAQVGRIIAINLGFGLLYSKIDNWGHVGGLLGGAAVAWLCGPALSIESTPGAGKKYLLDNPPIAKLLSPWSSQKGDH
jgi:membrane associated rhomboid family serine protease